MVKSQLTEAFAVWISDVRIYMYLEDPFHHGTSLLSFACLVCSHPQTLMTEIASTLERRRSNRNSYNSIGRPQSVTFDDDVFLPNGTHMSRGSSVHSNGSRTSFRDIVRSSPIPGHEKVEDYRNAVLNNTVKSNGSVSSDGYLFYYGKEKNSLKEMGLHDYDKNQIYATVNK